MSHLYPIVTTALVRECREFYVSALNARVLFGTDWYAHLSIDGWEIGFLRPDPPARLPMFVHTAPSRGLCLALEVEDVRAFCAQLQARNVPLLSALQEYEGGELGFSLIDPAGVVLNVVGRGAEARAHVEL